MFSSYFCIPFPVSGIWCCSSKAFYKFCPFWLWWAAYAPNPQVRVHSAHTHSVSGILFVRLTWAKIRKWSLFTLKYDFWLLHLSGCSHCSVWTRYDWNSQDRQWQNCSLYLANAGPHHGSEGAGGRRRTHRSHCLSHQRALSASMNEKTLHRCSSI